MTSSFGVVNGARPRRGPCYRVRNWQLTLRRGR